MSFRRTFMGKPRKRKLILLPGGWSKTVKSYLLHAMSLAFNALAFNAMEGRKHLPIVELKRVA